MAETARSIAAPERPIAEVVAHGSPRLLDRLRASSEPLVLRNLVEDWPLVKAGSRSVAEADRYLRDFYEDATVGAFVGEPSIGGRFFYNDDLTGFNFEAVRVKLDTLLDALLKYQNDARPPTFYVASTTVDTCLPGLRVQNDVELGDVDALASIWIGNRSRVAAHYDVPANLACVAVGRRRFTLFPPGEIGNLYVGPLDFTPAGQAISLVDFHRPDFDRFPRFRAALESARVAELEAGDAVLIPSMWWHHVESLDCFNVLINYWWRESPPWMGAPADVLNHAMLSLRGLPREQRDAWRAMFDHYVFGSGEQAARHIPEGGRGVLGPLDEAAARRLRADLLNKLNR